MASSYVKTSVPGIYRRGETYSCAFRDPITKRVRFQSAGTSFSDAKSLKRKLETAREQGQSLPSSSTLFTTVWSDFEEHHLNNLAASTQADYRSVYTKYLKPRWSRTPITSIDAAELLRFKTHLFKVKSATGEPLSAKRIRNILNVCSALFVYAVAVNAIWSNPVAVLGRSGAKTIDDNKPRVFLSPAQQVDFLNAVSEVNPDPTLRNLFHLMLHTGARYSEALAMRWCQVSLERRTITIDRSIYRGIEKTTKSGKQRVVGVSNSLLSALELQRESVPSEPGNLVFPSKKKEGRYLDPNGVRRYVFNRARDLCCERDPEFPKDCVVHSLRHSYASLLVNSGLVSLIQCRDLLGHSSVAVSEIYAHSTQENTVAAGVDALNSLA